MTITKVKFDAMMEAFRREFDKWGTDGGWFEVQKADSMYNYRGEDKVPVELGINWCACGTKSPEDTQKFINRLTIATNAVKTINSHKIIIDKTAVDYVDILIEKGEKEKAREVENNYVNYFIGAIKDRFIVFLLNDLCKA